MNQFAKLFEFKKDDKYKDDYQVLAIHMHNTTTDTYILKELTLIDNVQAVLDHEFDDMDSCIATFDNYTREHAEAFLLQMKISIDDATGKSRIKGTDFTKN